MHTSAGQCPRHLGHRTGALEPVAMPAQLHCIIRGSVSCMAATPATSSMQAPAAQLPLQLHGMPSAASQLPHKAAAAAAAAAVVAVSGLTDSLQAPVGPRAAAAAVAAEQQAARRTGVRSHMELAAAALQLPGQHLTPCQPRLLTRQISSCSSWQELQQVLQASGQSMNIIHVSAMLTRLGKLLRHSDGSTSPWQHQQHQGQQHQQGQQQRQPQQQQRRRRQWHEQQQQQELAALEAFLQQLENTAAQLMSVVQLQQGNDLEIWQRAGPQLLVQQHNGCSSFSAHAAQLQHVPVLPQQLSCIAWGWASVGFLPGQRWWSAYWELSTPQLHSYSLQELAMAIWSAGKLQQHPPAAWANAFEAASSRAMEAAATAATPIPPQAFCMITWGVAELRMQMTEGWWQKLQAAVLASLGQSGPRDLAQVLWAHARLQQLPPALWLCQVLSAAQACLLHFSGRDAAMLLWSLAGLQVKPAPELLSGLLQVMLMSNCKLDAAAPQDYAHILWALAAFKRQHQCPTSATSGNSSGSGSSGNSSSSSSGSSHDQPHPLLDPQLLARWAHTTWQYTQPSRASVSATDAAQLLWAASQLGLCCRPDAAWMQQLWATTGCQLHTFSSQALTTTMWAALRLGSPPPASWLLAAVPVLQEQQLADMSPAGACQLLLVLARLQHRPNPMLMGQLLSRLQLDSHQLQPRAFACVLWALGRLQYQPGQTWWDNILQHLQGQMQQLGQRELDNVLSGLVALQVTARLTPGLRQQLAHRMQQLGITTEPLD